MSNLTHKVRRSRRFRLELLESRELLSAVGPLANHPVDVSPLVKTHRETIKGSLSGQGSVTPITMLQGMTTFKSSGNTTVLGPATFDGSVSYSVNKRHAIKYTNGQGNLAGLSGSGAIDVSFSGSGHAVTVVDSTFSVKGHVTGGTGAFAGAAGSFKATGKLNSGVFSVNLTVTLTHT